MANIAPLLEAQVPALRRYAFALTRDRDLADDLVQDCLERAWSRRLLWRADSEIRAWLFTILRNLFIDAARAHRRRGPKTSFDGDADIAVEPSQESRLALRDTFDALDELPEESRSLILLIGVEDLSYAEAARVLNIPVGTVMSRLSRARERLRTLCESSRPVVLRRVK